MDSTLKLEAVPRRRLSEHVAMAIQDHIIETRRRAGDQLPSEPELEEQFGVSRTVIREASRLLVDRGLVTISPGRGMVVADFDGATMARQIGLMLAMDYARFEHLIEMRLVLEVGMTQYAALRRTDADLVAIEAALVAFAEPGLPHDRAIEADLEFHAAVAAASHNPFFEAIVNPMNDYLRSKYRPSVGYTKARERTLSEHTAIAEAIREGTVVEAGKCARDHLKRILHDQDTLVIEDLVINE